MKEARKEKILICGILPPPFFGHSMIYKILMQSGFVNAFDVIFFDMRFWSYKHHKRITILKIIKLIWYLLRYMFLIITRRPSYILYAISFDRMPLPKDFVFCLIGKLFSCRIVLHDMGQYVRELYDSSNRLYKWLTRRLTAIATACIVLGEKTRDVYDGFIEKNRIIAVHGSVEDSQHLMEISKDVNPTKTLNGKITVLYLSFLSVSKGVFTALKTIPEVVKKNPDIFFTFVGPIESSLLQEKVDRFINENQLESKVEYLGYISDEDKRAEIFRNSDIFIFPTHRDVFGLVLLHAMAEGLPIIASLEGAIPEIIEEGKNGYLFPKGDCRELAQKILTLAGDANLRRKMGVENRRKYLEYYTPEKYGQRMIEAFNKIKELD